MAIENVILLTEPLTTDALLRILIDEFGLTRTYDEISRQWIGLTGGMGVWVLEASELEKQVMKDRFNLENAELSAICRIDKFEFLDEGQDNQISLFFFLLRRFSGDLVILENGDKPLLLRQSGVVHVDLQDAFWRRKLLPRFSESGISFVEESGFS